MEHEVGNMFVTEVMSFPKLIVCPLMSSQRSRYGNVQPGVAAWLGQGSTKQTFTFAYAFAELSRIFRQKLSRHWWVSRRTA